LNELALFAGAGGGILGGHLLGWRTVCAVEWEPYAACVLAARQNDGLLPHFPIWDDVQTFDGRPWRGIVDVVSGGFPCQDISVAGAGAGLDGERSGMWREMARIIGEVRPRFAFVENSPMLVTRGLERVLADLTAMGYDSRWGVISAADIGAKHKRERIWIVANSKHSGYSNKIGGVNGEKVGLSEENRKEWSGSRMPIGTSDLVSGRTASRIFNERKNVADTNGISSKIRGDDHADEAISGARDYNSGRSGSNDWGKFDPAKNEDVAYSSQVGLCGQKAKQGMAGEFGFTQCGMDRKWWEREPANVPRTTERNMGGMVDGMASRVDRLKAIGNGQVPLCAKTAWELLK
jgi:DNA (cytosine-5)-methyltransferase 1